jgi:integrase/recombinase XerD
MSRTFQPSFLAQISRATIRWFCYARRRDLWRPTLSRFRSGRSDRDTRCGFESKTVTLSRLCAGDVVRFVQRQAPRLHLKRAKLLTTALRSFLQYTRYRGYVRLDLAAAVPRVANWSRPSIPRAIAPGQVRRLLAQINRRTAVGRRDYAILLLLARLGLPSCEVAFFEPDDIAWRDGSLSVHSKGDGWSNCPCPKMSARRSPPT